MTLNFYSKPVFLRQFVITLALLTVAVAGHTQNYGNNISKTKGKWIIGAKAARIDNNIDQVEDADAVGIVLGYEFDKAIGNLSGSSTIELEYLDGSTTDVNPILVPLVTGAPSSEFITTTDPDVLNLFYTYRSATNLYYKLKLGVSYSEVSYTGTNGFSDIIEEVALAGGIGIGYRIGDFGVVELEYSGDTGDNELSLFSINALLQF